MAEPFIFILTCTLKEGKLEGYKQYTQEHCRFVEANEPRLLAFESHINEDGTEVTVVQVHPAEASMALHMQVAREHFVKAYEYLDSIKSMQIYGTPGDALLQQIKQASGPGAPVVVKSEFAGFNRLPLEATT